MICALSCFEPRISLLSNNKHQDSHGVLKVLKMYSIVKSVLKTLEKYWLLLICTQSIEKVWKFQIQPLVHFVLYTVDDGYADALCAVFYE